MARFCSARCLLLTFLLRRSFVRAQGAAGSPPHNPRPSQPMVTGTIASLQPMALPPNAAIEVKVQDVSGGGEDDCGDRLRRRRSAGADFVSAFVQSG